MKKTKNKTSLLKKIVKIAPIFVGVAIVTISALALKDIEVDTVLPISEVNVHGEMTFLNKNRIKSVVEDNIVGGFFTVDLNSVREAVLQEPWVKSVALRRQWPAGIDVFIEENQPVAFWNDDAYISRAGYVFNPRVIDKKLKLPILSGPDGQHNNVWKFMNVLYKEMDALGYSVTTLGMDARRAWRLQIKNNKKEVSDEIVGEQIESLAIDVRLGRFDTEKRLQRFIRVLPALASKREFAQNEIEVIDMRYPNGFAVKMTATEEAANEAVSLEMNTTENSLHISAYKHQCAMMQKCEAAS